jgi:hypothetical protein
MFYVPRVVRTDAAAVAAASGFPLSAVTRWSILTTHEEQQPILPALLPESYPSI